MFTGERCTYSVSNSFCKICAQCTFTSLDQPRNPRADALGGYHRMGRLSGEPGQIAGIAGGAVHLLSRHTKLPGDVTIRAD